MALAEKVASIILLTIGLEKSELGSLAPVFEHCKTFHMPLDLNKLASGAIAIAAEGNKTVKPDIVIVGEPPNQISIHEVAQTARVMFPEATIFCVLRNRKLYYRKELIKNGFNDAFLFPLEAAWLRRTAYATVSRLTNGKVKSYRNVRLGDIKLGTELPCRLAIFLPVNNKYVHFLNDGVAFVDKHIEKLRSHRINAVHVEAGDLPAFYTYAKSQSGNVSTTETRHGLEDEVRRVVGGIFRGEEAIGIEEGQKISEEFKQLVHKYILSFPTHEVAHRVVSMMGQDDDLYSHLINVAMYGALFAMALEAASPADVALAGLLHDIGMVDIPEHVVLKPVAEHGEEDTILYRKHVERSIAFIQEYKIPLSGPAMKAIYQHHECPDQTGYPSAMARAGISKEAQVLAVADRFDYATRFAHGQPQLLPEDMLERFRKQTLATGQHMPVEPELAKKVLDLFLTK